MLIWRGSAWYTISFPGNIMTDSTRLHFTKYVCVEGGSARVFMASMLECDIIIRKFESGSRYYFYFRTITFCKY